MSAAPSATRNGRTRDIESQAAELYAEHRAYLLGIATRNALNPEDAEEALQEAFIAFIRSYDPANGAHPLAWLTLVMKRECWHRTRREYLDRRAGQEADLDANEVGCAIALLPYDGPSPHDAAESAERVRETREYLAKLKPAERECLGLKAAGLSYEEIMELKDWTYTKVNRLMAEGRKRLFELAGRG